MAQKFKDAARGELVDPITTSSTSIEVTNGNLFSVATVDTGALSSGDWFKAVLQDDSNIEIVYVRTHELVTSPNLMTNVLRGQDGTTAKAFPAGAVFGIRPTAGDMDAAINGKVDKVAGKSLSTENYSTADKDKLAGIAANATSNASDAYLLDRAYHTNTQAISTIAGLQTALDAKQAPLVSGTNIKTVGGQSLLGSGDVPLGDFLYGGPEPDSGGGSDGDVYIQSNGKLWKKAAGAWTYTGIQFAAQTAAMLLTGAQSASGVKTFTDRSAHAGAYTPSAQPAHSATPTFDCATSNVFEPATMTGNVTSITLSNAVAGQTVQIRFQQDATGGRTVAVPSGAKVDGSINTAADRVSWLILTYSSRGARWEGNWLVIPS